MWKITLWTDNGGLFFGYFTQQPTKEEIQAEFDRQIARDLVLCEHNDKLTKDVAAALEYDDRPILTEVYVVDNTPQLQPWCTCNRGPERVLNEQEQNAISNK